MAPEIRILVIDTTGPVARFTLEAWPRDRALAFHGLAPETKTAAPVGGGRRVRRRDCGAPKDV